MKSTIQRSYVHEQQQKKQPEQKPNALHVMPQNRAPPAIARLIANTMLTAMVLKQTAVMPMRTAVDRHQMMILVLLMLIAQKLILMTLVTVRALLAVMLMLQATLTKRTTTAQVHANTRNLYEAYHMSSCYSNLNHLDCYLSSVIVISIIRVLYSSHLQIPHYRLRSCLWLIVRAYGTHSCITTF